MASSGSTPGELTVKAPAALHLVYPTGRPTPDPAQPFREPEVKTYEERQKEKRRSREKALRRLRSLLEEAKAYGRGLEEARAGRLAPLKPDLPMEALAPAARGELAVVMRADDEEDIRGAVRFAEERGLRLILAGGAEAWRCVDLLKEKRVKKSNGRATRQVISTSTLRRSPISIRPRRSASTAGKRWNTGSGR